MANEKQGKMGVSRFKWMIRAETCGHAEALGQALGKQVKLILQRLGVILLSHKPETCIIKAGHAMQPTMQYGWNHSSKTLYYLDWLCT